MFVCFGWSVCSQVHYGPAELAHSVKYRWLLYTRALSCRYLLSCLSTTPIPRLLSWWCWEGGATVWKTCRHEIFHSILVLNKILINTFLIFNKLLILLRVPHLKIWPTMPGWSRLAAWLTRLTQLTIATVMDEWTAAAVSSCPGDMPPIFDGSMNPTAGKFLHIFLNEKETNNVKT